jgi:class 3 adenylate cyclase
MPGPAPKHKRSRPPEDLGKSTGRLLGILDELALEFQRLGGQKNIAGAEEGTSGTEQQQQSSSPELFQEAFAACSRLEAEVTRLKTENAVLLARIEGRTIGSDCVVSSGLSDLRVGRVGSPPPPKEVSVESPASAATSGVSRSPSPTKKVLFGMSNSDPEPARESSRSKTMDASSSASGPESQSDADSERQTSSMNVRSASAAYSTRSSGRKGTVGKLREALSFRSTGGKRRSAGFEPGMIVANPEAEPGTGEALAIPMEGNGTGDADVNSENGQKIKKDKKRAPPGPLAVAIYRFLELKVVQIWMLLLTIGILYCNDIFQAYMSVQEMDALTVCLWICFAFFSLEWILNIISSNAQSTRYIFSLFFYLDFACTVLILVDIVLASSENLTEQGPIARAARAGRIGTRAGRSVRLIRLVRFIRLVRITRVVKVAQKIVENWRFRNQMKRPSIQEEEAARQGDLQHGSSQDRADSVGAKIGSIITRKVIIMTLILLIVLPFFQRDQTPQICNGELLEALRQYFLSPSIGQNCTTMQEESKIWFGSDSYFLEYSRQDHQSTRDGIIYAVVENCELYRSRRVMGTGIDDWAEQRKTSEIRPIPCNAVVSSLQNDQVSNSYLIYDLKKEMEEEAMLNMGFTTVIVGIILLFSLIFSNDAEMIANRIVKPMRKLMVDMQATARLQLDNLRTVEITSDIYEVQSLQSSFVQLAAAVGSFSKFTPLEVVRHLLSLGTEAQLGVTQRNVTIFFSDIASFTTICESTPPQKVLTLLSEYFERMVSIIIEEHGTMLEFIGDAILAIWNAPAQVEEHRKHAVTAALRMHETLDTLRKEWQGQGKPEVRIRVGLHSADVYVGNLGSKMRMKYGVLGDGVNLASRLEELNKRYSTEILCSEEVLNSEGMRDNFVIRPLDFVVVKGRKTPTPIYEVLAPQATASEEYIQIASHAEMAMQAYLKRDFRTAITTMENIVHLKGGARDKAGEVLIERCKNFLAKPPPEDWDGSEILKDKSF